MSLKKNWMNWILFHYMITSYIAGLLTESRLMPYTRIDWISCNFNLIQLKMTSFKHKIGLIDIVQGVRHYNAVFFDIIGIDDSVMELYTLFAWLYFLYWIILYYSYYYCGCCCNENNIIYIIWFLSVFKKGRNVERRKACIQTQQKKVGVRVEMRVAETVQ